MPWPPCCCSCRDRCSTLCLMWLYVSTVCMFTLCGGEWWCWVVLETIYCRTFTLFCMWPDSDSKKIDRPLQEKSLGGEGCLRKINSCSTVLFQVTCKTKRFALFFSKTYPSAINPVQDVYLLACLLRSTLMNILERCLILTLNNFQCACYIVKSYLITMPFLKNYS